MVLLLHGKLILRFEEIPMLSPLYSHTAAWLLATFSLVSYGQDTELADLDYNESQELLEPVKYSEQEKAKTCKKYQNSYVSYYGAVYRVEKCKLRHVQSHEKILEINRRQKKIREIPGTVIAQLDKGKPINSETARTKKLRTCKQLSSKYVTFSYTDVYYVDKCIKRPFPDWSSFVAHRKRHKRSADSVLALTWAEFARLKSGRTMPSEIDREFRKMKLGSRGVDVIPLSEACRGLNGKDVTYVDTIYRIEGCRKRAYDSQKFLRKNRNRDLKKLKELSSEQWLSIPDGKAMR